MDYVIFDDSAKVTNVLFGLMTLVRNSININKRIKIGIKPSGDFRLLKKDM